MTTRIGLRTNVVVSPQRQTPLLAKQAAEVDLLSNERLILGVGVGWNHFEYDALGMDFSTRGARLAEQLQVARLLWTQPVVTFTGQYHDLDRCGLNPLPRRVIPVWMGGASEAAVNRAATAADGFGFAMPGSFTYSLVAQLHVALAAAGRDRDTFDMDVTVDHVRGVDTIGRVARTWAAIDGTSITVNTGEATGSRPDGGRSRVGVASHVSALGDVVAAIRSDIGTAPGRSAG